MKHMCVSLLGGLFGAPEGGTRNCLTTKYLYFGGKVFFGHNPYGIMSGKLRNSNRYVLS